MEEVRKLNGVFAVARELKGPLATVRQLAFSMSGGLSAEDERAREEIIRATERAIKQVNDLTRLSRAEAGWLEVGPVAVRGVVDEVTKELRDLFRGRRGELGVKFANRERLVTANAEMLHSVIYNFALGALGDFERGVSENRARAEILVRDFRGTVRIDIRDFGPELSTEVWREIRRGGGMTEGMLRPGAKGLGLFIASRFSKVMGAEVGAVRHRDGTSFYVELPVSRQMGLF